jgi:D-alanyl-D-alanine carboxypeptidase
LLREPAARALEQLFAKADEAGITLYGVSGYRSYVTQKAIFNNNVRTQGYTQARRYSAFPGTSEHQTGLSIDVSSASAGYALEEKFGTTPEGKWLQAHCAESGFIIRYPKGKEGITGYAYEPWHIRFVGVTIATEIMSQSLTLEEYFGDAAAATVQN